MIWYINESARTGSISINTISMYFTSYIANFTTAVINNIISNIIEHVYFTISFIFTPLKIALRGDIRHSKSLQLISNSYYLVFRD